MYDIETDCEVAVVGGGMAGLSAALMVARARIGVWVIDDPVAAIYKGEAHNFLTQDGRDKAAIAAAGLEDVLRYPEVTHRRARVTEIARDAAGYALTLSTGDEVTARRLIVAPGLDHAAGASGIEGFDERFGRDVLTCPYCHGYEHADRRLALIGTAPNDVDMLRLLSNWSANLAYIAHDGPAAAEVAAARPGVEAVEGRVVALSGEPGRPVAHLGDGREVAADAFFLADLPGRPGWPLIEGIGVERGLHPVTKKPVYKTDAVGRTDLGDVFLVGDARTGFSTLAGAAHEGAIAGFMTVNDVIEARTAPVADPLRRAV